MRIAILHCIPDSDDPYQLVRDLMAAVPPGSCLAISHPARDQLEVANRAEESLTDSMGQKVTFPQPGGGIALLRRARAAGPRRGADPGVAPRLDSRPQQRADRHVGRRGEKALTKLTRRCPAAGDFRPERTVVRARANALRARRG
jgi:hypothetical protein